MPEIGSILTKAQPVKATDDYVTALIYGRSGSGKTTLASTFPKKILLLDIRDKGTDSIKDVDGIDVISIDNWQEFEAVYWALTNEPHDYKTVIIDTISNLQDLAIAEAKRRAKSDSESMSQRLWGDTARILNQWIYHYRDLPMNVVFTAQERSKRGTDEENFDDQLDPEVGPAVMPSVSKTLCAAVKVIGNTYIRQVMKPDPKNIGQMKTITNYMIRAGPHPYYITKIRSPKSSIVPTAVKNPSYETIRALMKGEIETKE